MIPKNQYYISWELLGLIRLAKLNQICNPPFSSTKMWVYSSYSRIRIEVEYMFAITKSENLGIWSQDESNQKTPAHLCRASFKISCSDKPDFSLGEAERLGFIECLHLQNLDICKDWMAIDFEAVTIWGAILCNSLRK